MSSSFLRHSHVLGIFCLLAAQLCFSQKTNPDSLKQLLSQSAPADKVAAERMQALSAHYYRIKPDSSTYFANASLSIAQQLQDKELIANAKFLLGNVLMDKQEGDAARTLFVEAIELFKAAGNTEKLIETTGNYAVTYLNQNDYKEAKVWIDRTMQMATENHYLKGQAFATGSLALIADQLGDKDLAIVKYNEAIQYYSKAGEKGRVAVLQHNIGALYSNLEDHQSAIRYTKLACEGYRSVQNLRSLNNALLNLAYYYKELDSLPQAENCLKMVAESTYKINNSQKSLFLILKGQIAESRKDYSTAITLLDSSIVLAKTSNSPINLHNGHATLARIQLEQKDYQTALKNALLALELAQNVGDAVSINLDQKFISKAYEGLGNNGLAFQYLRQYEAGRDTLYTKEIFQAIENVERKYESEKKEFKIQKQKEKIKHQNWMMAIMLAFALFTGISSFMLYKSNRERKRLIRILSDKNEKQAQLIEDFNEELNKLKKQKESIEAIKALPLPLQNGTILQLGEVFYIEGNDNFVSLHTAKGVCHEWQTMNHYENLLAETTLFCRTHRSYLVNRLHIKKIRSKEITMTNGDVVAIATTQSTKAAVFGWLEEWGLSTNN